MKKIIIYLTLAIIFFAASWSLFRNNFFYVHDFTQGARIVTMQQSLIDGHFPVRWTSDFGYGYGMPLFEFYAPLPYYVGAFIYSLGFSLVNSVKSLFLISTLVTVIGGFKLGKKLFGTSWGLVVSAALALAPYRALNLFVRGAVSESWGIMALPFVLYGIIQVIRKEKYGWITLLLSLFTLMLSHNLTTLMFVPLSLVFGGIYLCLYIKDESKKKKLSLLFNRLFSLAGVYLLGLLLSSFYLIPALLEKDFTRVESAILTDYFDYNIHFVFIKQFFQSNWKYGGSSWGPTDDISFFLGAGQLIALVTSLLIFARHIFIELFRTKKKITLNKILRLFDTKTVLMLSIILLFLVSIFMTVGRSKFIWDSINFLSFIQFPWRWLSSAIVFLSLISGFSGLFLKNKIFSYGYAAFIIFMILATNWQFFQPEKFITDTSDVYYSDRTKIRTEMSKTLPDFIPSNFREDILSPITSTDTVLYCENNNDCSFNFETVNNKTHQKEVKVSLDKFYILEFATAYFPGWEVKVDGEVIEHDVSDFGTILVPVESGEHTVELSFKNTNLRIIADLLSIFGLVVFLAVFFWYHGKLERKLKKISK